MSKRKVINLEDSQFEYVNAVEIKELSAKYLIGQYTHTKKPVILHLVIDGDNYIIDSSKRTDIEKIVLNKYFASKDGGESFKKALLNGDIVSFYYDMPDAIGARREEVSKISFEHELKPIIISTSQVEIPSISDKIKQDRYAQIERVGKLINNLQNEINRCYDVINSVVNIDI